MSLRIKEIARQKGITMGELAQRLGITQISLSQCLSGNPSLKRLEEIADILQVDLVDLFNQSSKPGIQGCIFIDGEAHIVKSKSDIESILSNL